jgi:hypothetical protein
MLVPDHLPAIGVELDPPAPLDDPPPPPQESDKSKGKKIKKQKDFFIKDLLSFENKNLISQRDITNP